MSCNTESDGEEGRTLTLTQARLAVLQALFRSLLFPFLGGMTFLGRGDKIIGVFLCLIAPSQWLLLAQSIKNYRLIKQGVTVYLPHRTSPLAPKFLSVPVVFVLSVVVLVIDAMAIFIAGVRVRTLEACGIAGAVCVPLTLYTAYCSHRIIGEQRRVRANALYQEDEGVWPPAPQTPQDK